MRIKTICRLQNALESLARRSPIFAPNLTYKTVRQPISTFNTPYYQYNSLLLVSKLKPTSPYYLPYLNAFFSVIVPTKKPTKKPAKQALKSTLATLTPLAAPPAGRTRSISNALAYSRTASITPKAFTANKHKRLSAPPPLGPLKPSQHIKLIKVTKITRIEPPIDRSQCIQFQNKQVKEVKKAILYQALEGYSYCRHYYNETEEEVKARKERRRDKLYAKQECDIT